MARKPFYPTHSKPKTLILGIHAPYNHTTNIESYFDEFRSLVKTNRGSFDYEQYIKIRTIDSTAFISKGKLDALLDFSKEHNIEEIIISEPLTAQQERNLNKLFNCSIIDRTHLILDIFEKAAHSSEGKKQVEIAKLQYEKTRVAGKGISMGQQAGFLGTRGPGETAKEKELRHIDHHIQRLRNELRKLEEVRQTQRKQRLSSGEAQIALIGYTNAGKSTILNTLTKASVLAEDKLFATLDTTTRELWLQNAKIGLISDTVGFIQQLPHQLINAFKSTLAELQFADLLLHVIDVSDTNWQDHIKVVREILTDLDVDKQMLYIFNKADKVADIDAIAPSLSYYQPHVVISSTSKQTMQPLINFLVNWKQLRNPKTD